MKTKYQHISLLAFVLLTAFSVRCVAQESNSANVVIKQSRLEVIENNSKLYVSMDIVFSGKVVAPAYGLKLVPVLKSDNRSVELPYVLINGKQRAAYFEREKALLPYDSKKFDGLYASIVNQRSRQQQPFVQYRVSIPYQPWMENASLLLRRIQVDCCTETPLPDMVIPPIQTEPVNRPVVSIQAPKHVTTTVKHIKPAKEEAKTRVKHTSVYINYPQGKSEILPHFASNATELQKVRDILLPLLTNNLYTLEHINITGCASPEGSYALNERLSRSRAYHFREYLALTYKLKNNLFTLFHIAEDWDKLVDLIGKHPVPESARVLDLIKHTQAPDEREEKLKRLSGGIPYRYMYNNLYPKLRRIDIAIQYTIKERDNESN